MSGTPRSILDLPAELYALILDHIQQSPRASHDFFSIKNESTKTLISICLTCRTLSDVFQPALYKSIGVSTDSNDDTWTETDDTQEREEEEERETHVPERITQLNRTIAERPDLARKITKLQLKLGSRRFFAKPGEIVYCDILTDKNARHELNLFGQLQWLLSQLENLEDLDFRSDSTYRSLWKSIFDRGNTNGPGHQFLPNLKKFHTAPHHSNLAPLYSPEIGYFVSAECWRFARETVFDLADFQPLFEHPGLKHLALTFVAPLAHYGAWPRLILSSVHLQSLELWRCHLPGSILTQILQACHGLRILRIDSDVDMDDELVLPAVQRGVAFDDHGRVVRDPVLNRIVDTWNGCVISIAKMQWALETCAETLEELSLKFYSEDFSENSNDPHELSFRHFPQLRKLIITGDKVVLKSALPPSIEQVICCQVPMGVDWATVWPQLENFRALAEVPKLRRLCLVGPAEGKLDHISLLQDKRYVRSSNHHPLPGGEWEERTMLYSIAYDFDDLEVEIIDDGRAKEDSSDQENEDDEDDSTIPVVESWASLGAL